MKKLFTKHNKGFVYSMVAVLSIGLFLTAFSSTASAAGKNSMYGTYKYTSSNKLTTGTFTITKNKITGNMKGLTSDWKFDYKLKVNSTYEVKNAGKLKVITFNKGKSNNVSVTESNVGKFSYNTNQFTFKVNPATKKASSFTTYAYTNAEKKVQRDMKSIEKKSLYSTNIFEDTDDTVRPLLTKTEDVLFERKYIPGSRPDVEQLNLELLNLMESYSGFNGDPDSSGDVLTYAMIVRDKAWTNYMEYFNLSSNYCTRKNASDKKLSVDILKKYDALVKKHKTTIESLG